MAFIIEGNFFCRFKTGDNIIDNLYTLRKLYDLEKELPRKETFIKPIIIIITSIIEAILYDFHLRIRANVNEGVFGLSDVVIRYIRNKRFDELEELIESASEHNFFNSDEESFYDKLHELRKARNRIHIQNMWSQRPLNESELFIEPLRAKAEQCLEKVVKTMSTNFARPGRVAGYVGKLYFPWQEHFN